MTDSSEVPVSEAEGDLLSVLHTQALAVPGKVMTAIALTSAADFVITIFFGDERYYIALLFLSATCFAVYGLSARRAVQPTGDVEADYARVADARIIMKGAALLGISSAVATLLCLFLLVLGPSWTL